jgi:hypothetical protein
MDTCLSDLVIPGGDLDVRPVFQQQGTVAVELHLSIQSPSSGSSSTTRAAIG